MSCWTCESCSRLSLSGELLRLVTFSVTTVTKIWFAVGRLLPREENLFLHDLPANASSREAAAEFQKIITTAKNVAGADGMPILPESRARRLQGFPHASEIRVRRPRPHSKPATSWLVTRFPPVDHSRGRELDWRPHTSSTRSSSIDSKWAASRTSNTKSIPHRILPQEAPSTIRYGRG